MKKFFKGTLWALLGLLVAGLGLLLVSFIAVRNADADFVQHLQRLPDEVKAQIEAQMPPSPAVPAVRWSQAELPTDVTAEMAKYPFDLKEFGEMREDVSLCVYTPPAVDDWQSLLSLFMQHEKEMLPPERFPDEERDGESILASYKLRELKLWKNAEGGDAILRATLCGNAGYRPLPDRVFFFLAHEDTGLLSPMPHWWIQNLSPIFVR
ncbi:MAG: hypothetical protein R3Y56_05025 [Akkermansia sp.]